MRPGSFLIGLLVALASVSLASAQEKPARPAKAASVVTPVDLNTATAAQLEALPGIGARTAKLIIEHREKNGGFKKIEELMNIKGVGEKSFLKLKSLVVVSSPKTPADTRR